MNNGFLRKLYRSKDLEFVDSKLLLLGEQQNVSAVTFLTVRFFTTFVVFILLLYIMNFGYLVAPVVAIFYYHIFYYITIDRPIKERAKRLDREAVEFFEILTLTLESRRNLEIALEMTVLYVKSELADEFKKTLFEIKFGKTLLEALEDMKKRIPSENINNVLLNITQTDVFGNNIVQTMYNQIDFLRDKQLLEIKEQINKIPNKVSIISVLFVVPLILLLVLGPFLIQFIG